MVTYQEKLAQAQAQNNAAAMADNERRLGEKQDALAAQQSALAEFVIYSKKAGSFEAMAKVRSKVAEGEILARIAGEPVTQTTFQTDRKVAVGDEVKIANHEDPQATMTCTVDDVNAETITVECMGGLAAGTKVLLAGFVEDSADVP